MVMTSDFYVIRVNLKAVGSSPTGDVMSFGAQFLFTVGMCTGYCTLVLQPFQSLYF